MHELKPFQPLPPIRRDMDILANRLPPSRALAGQTIGLESESGALTTLTFTETRVRWNSARANQTLRRGDDTYDAVEIQPGVFFIDYVLADGSMAFSHVVDHEGGRALTVSSEIIDAGAGSSLRELLIPAKLAGHLGEYEPIGETRELLGKRISCEYSRDVAIEHIYVNSATIVWQWLRSPPEFALEVGMDAGTMWKIQDRLYLISMRSEGLQLTLLLDLKGMRSVGRLFGGEHSRRVDRRCGAKLTFLGEFVYPEGYRPG
jgi:hypothetical protein